MQVLLFAGCPIRQEIYDSSLAMAYGDGLSKGIEDQEAAFFVDVRGQRGDLDVRVDGRRHFSINTRSNKSM